MSAAAPQHFPQDEGTRGTPSLYEVPFERRPVRASRRGRLVRRALLATDVLGLAIAFVVAELLFGLAGPGGHVHATAEFVLFFATLPGWLVVAKLYELYDHDEERTYHTTIDDVVGVFHLVTVGAWIFFIGAWLTKLVHPNLPKLVAFWALAIVLVTAGRAVARMYAQRRPDYLQRAVVVGAGDVGQVVARKLVKHREYGIEVLGFVDDQPRALGEDVDHLPILGSPKLLPNLVRTHGIDRVLIAFSTDRPEDTLAILRAVKGLGVQLDLVPRLFEIVGPNAGLHTVEGLPLVGLTTTKPFPFAMRIKRLVDIAGSLFGLTVTAPLLAAIAIAIKLDSRGPVIYKQPRRGKHGSEFRIFKFRTMYLDAEARKAEIMHMNQVDGPLFKIKGEDPRVTRVGRFLRKTSLDELPQFWNVLRGEMSLVGPRPFILPEADQITGWANCRLDMTPGITGLWQMLGRNEIPFDEMVRLDYLYVSDWSLWWDLKILIKTIPAVLSRRFAY
jgi:exopolysaccharide biosynthesis polyprenyl glycosylphosphotransferase